MKKQSVYSAAILLFLLFIISSSKSSARFLETKQGEEDKKLNEIISGTSLLELESNEETADLMGIEECDKEDDKCLKGRIMAEAHLDYIYTQHHKP
ncbi:hypothetical protein FNV43_RR05546 [Rhamnella rubrinervis]|uniref:Phytosulfokine n=1 Tax=Rhamnella rubrinervis TaxID=2594499 RepID=A0A8K0HP68_9ROSA|nr:hypothetical protein FNV43_RR05546 [Rhamnella rubrinervis]